MGAGRDGPRRERALSRATQDRRNRRGPAASARAALKSPSNDRARTDFRMSRRGGTRRATLAGRTGRQSRHPLHTTYSTAGQATSRNRAMRWRRHHCRRCHAVSRRLDRTADRTFTARPAHAPKFPEFHIHEVLRARGVKLCYDPATGRESGGCCRRLPNGLLGLLSSTCRVVYGRGADEAIFPGDFSHCDLSVCLITMQRNGSRSRTRQQARRDRGPTFTGFRPGAG